MRTCEYNTIPPPLCIISTTWMPYKNYNFKYTGSIVSRAIAIVDSRGVIFERSGSWRCIKRFVDHDNHHYFIETRARCEVWRM